MSPQRDKVKRLTKCNLRHLAKIILEKRAKKHASYRDP